MNKNINDKLNNDFNGVMNGTLYFFPGDAEEDEQRAEEESYNLSPWYGKERENYLRAYMDKDELLIMEHTGALRTHLVYIDKQAKKREMQLTEEMAETEGINSELKKSNPKLWVGAMNNLRQRVREIIQHDMIYTGYHKNS
ncbi:MAG: TnpV protein [Clostridiales bacterium]|nr:TnpV protein [Clostridiales bacterium]